MIQKDKKKKEIINRWRYIDFQNELLFDAGSIEETLTTLAKD
jgi:hypothetical protein